MNWKEWKAKIQSESQKAIPRGNVFWAIKNGKILCHYLHMINGEWVDAVYQEEDDPPYLTCPKTFLRETDTVNQEWREKVMVRHDDRTEKRKNIKTLFQNRKEDEKIIAHLQAKPGFMLWSEKSNKTQKKMELVIEEVNKASNKLVGRSRQDDRLYFIPLGMIKEVTIEKG